MSNEHTISRPISVRRCQAITHLPGNNGMTALTKPLMEAPLFF